MSEKYIVDNLKKFGSEFQIKCISGLVSDKTFIERISDILEPDSFETDAHKFIVKETISYFLQYKDLPTLAVFKVKVDSIENDLLKQSVVEQLRLVYQKISDGLTIRGIDFEDDLVYLGTLMEYPCGGECCGSYWEVDEYNLDQLASNLKSPCAINDRAHFCGRDSPSHIDESTGL